MARSIPQGHTQDLGLLLPFNEVEWGGGEGPPRTEAASLRVFHLVPSLKPYGPGVRGPTFGPVVADEEGAARAIVYHGEAVVAVLRNYASNMYARDSWGYTRVQ